jgi:hypothetical protein
MTINRADALNVAIDRLGSYHRMVAICPHPGSVRHGQAAIEIGEDRMVGDAQLTTSVPAIPFWPWPGMGQT